MALLSNELCGTKLIDLRSKVSSREGSVLKNLGAIALIFCGASLAWLILGATLVTRTDDSDSTQRGRLSSQWGSAQTQDPPKFTVQVDAHHTVQLPILGSRIDVGLNLTQRRKGLLWYNLYDVSFAGHYTVKNTTKNPNMLVTVTLPASDATLADFVVRVDGHAVDDDQPVPVAPGASAAVEISYQSRGMDSWSYGFADKDVARATDFILTMTTNFQAIDFPPKTLLPTSEVQDGSGWQLQWKYATLVTGNAIGMTIPYPLQPGPLAQRITFWAPVSLLFYMFVMLLITTLRGIHLHPTNYFFLASAFFAFHLLLAYLVDRIPLEAAFAICSIVSMFLTITYLRLVIGWRFAAFEAGLVQLIYLVLFSWALFNEGWSGLTITIGAIITLFVAMQLTGKIRWSERFAAPSYS
jgi:hypothetical protein